MTANVTVVCAPGFEEIEAVTIIDLLRRANARVKVTALGNREVTGAHQLAFKADSILNPEGPLSDALVLPGGMPGTTNLADSNECLSLLQKQNGAGKICAAICAAPTVLARAGIIAGKKVTCYPGFETHLVGAHVTKQPVEIDGNIVTSRGIGTAIDFSLALIRLLFDEKTARTVGEAVLHTGTL